MAFLTREEERKLIRAGQRGNVESRNRVIMNIYPIIEREVKKRLYMRDQIQDAINFVISVLIEKFHKFELSRNLRYATYALFWVRQSIQNFTNSRFMIHIPTYLLQPQKSKKATVERYKVQSGHARRIASIEPNSKGDHTRKNFEDQFTSKEVSPFDKLSKQENIELAKRLLDGLPPRDREVVMRRCNGETLLEIGESMGITRERVRQIEFNSLGLLKRRLKISECGTLLTKNTVHV